MSRLVTVLRIGLGLAFVYAAVTKLAVPGALAEDIANYRLVPATVTPWLATMLPGVELVVGTLLVIGRSTLAAGALAAGMMAVFTVAVATAVARGLDIDCGCFGSESRVGSGVILRDLALLAVALVVTFAGGGASNRGQDA